MLGLEARARARQAGEVAATVVRCDYGTRWPATDWGRTVVAGRSGGTEAEGAIEGPREGSTGVEATIAGASGIGGPGT